MKGNAPLRDVPEHTGSADVFACWWSMVKAHRECAGFPPLSPDDCILHFMGSGASCMVFAKDIEAVCKILEERKETSQ